MIMQFVMRRKQQRQPNRKKSPSFLSCSSSSFLCSSTELTANTMEMYSHGSSSSSSGSSIATKPSSGHDYEVFLSFRGPDTRAGFTDYLYHSLRDAGVHVFRDDEELRVGEEISKNLTEAINNSKISIPIFSKAYASSKWCLEELTHIADNSKAGSQIVMPIFYNITPFDVRHQTGSFEEAFQLHGSSFSEEIVRKWKETLKEIGSLKGWDLTTGMGGNMKEKSQRKS